MLSRKSASSKKERFTASFGITMIAMQPLVAQDTATLFFGLAPDTGQRHFGQSLVGLHLPHVLRLQAHSHAQFQRQPGTIVNSDPP